MGRYVEWGWWSENIIDSIIYMIIVIVVVIYIVDDSINKWDNECMNESMIIYDRMIEYDRMRI